MSCWSERFASRCGWPPTSTRLAAAPRMPPGGFLGKAASRVLVGGQPQKEATQSLRQLKGLLEA